MRVKGSDVESSFVIDGERLDTVRSADYTTDVLEFEFSAGVEVFSLTFG